MPQPRKKQQKKAEKAKKLHCKIFLTFRFITFLLLRCIWKKFTWDHSYSISFSPFLFRGKVALTMFYWLPHQAEREELSLDQDLNVISRHMQTIQLGSTVNIIGTVGCLPRNIMHPVFIHMYLLFFSIRGVFFGARMLF